jgi:hypothetical protein
VWASRASMDSTRNWLPREITLYQSMPNVFASSAVRLMRSSSSSKAKFKRARVAM